MNFTFNDKPEDCFVQEISTSNIDSSICPSQEVVSSNI